MSDEAKVELKLVPNPGQRPYGCTACCGWVENTWVCAADADETVAVCGDCLREGDLDGKLARTAEMWERRADDVRAYAAHVRSLVGRLKVPTFAEWHAADNWGQVMDCARELREEALAEEA